MLLSKGKLSLRATTTIAGLRERAKLYSLHRTPQLEALQRLGRIEYEREAVDLDDGMEWQGSPEQIEVQRRHRQRIDRMWLFWRLLLAKVESSNVAPSAAILRCLSLGLEDVIDTERTAGGRSKRQGDFSTDAVAKILFGWASNKPLVSQVHIFGSRVRGDHRHDSDVDVAVSLDGSASPYIDDAEGLTAWSAVEDDWRWEVRTKIPLAVDFQFSHPTRTPTLAAALKRSSILVYDKRCPPIIR